MSHRMRIKGALGDLRKYTGPMTRPLGFATLSLPATSHRQITVLCSEDEVEASMDATLVMRVRAPQRERLRGKRNRRIASGVQNFEPVQRVTDGATDGWVALGKR